MTERPTSKPALRLGAALLACALLWSWPVPSVHANTMCLSEDNKCDPDKLCTFKLQLAEKVYLYQLYLANSPRAKAKGSREGVPYDGSIYDQSVREAAAMYPNATGDELSSHAADLFQDNLRKYAVMNFEQPTCTGMGKNKPEMLPKPGYTGAETTEKCQVFIKFEGGQFQFEGFGASDTTRCQEFYDRDYAHEVIHQQRCLEAQKTGKNLHTLDNSIEEEIVAYRHTVRLSKAYLRLMSIRCSTLPKQNEVKARAKKIQDLLKRYITKKGG